MTRPWPVDDQGAAEVAHVGGLFIRISICRLKRCGTERNRRLRRFYWLVSSLLSSPASVFGPALMLMLGAGPLFESYRAQQLAAPA